MRYTKLVGLIGMQTKQRGLPETKQAGMNQEHDLEMVQHAHKMHRVVMPQPNHDN